VQAGDDVGGQNDVIARIPAKGEDGFVHIAQKERREHGLSDDLGELVREYEETLPEYAEKLKWLIGFSEEERQEKEDG
jgi:hypothetical protein